MKEKILQQLCCAVCRDPNLAWHSYENQAKDEIKEGVVWCTSCQYWYPIEDGLLEFLPPKLAYQDDRTRFGHKYQKDLQTRGLDIHKTDSSSESVELQKKQQDHFDWYSNNEVQDYNSYERLPFWEAVDAATFTAWRKRIQPEKWLLDIGCAQGRSTFKLMDLPLTIVGFDISKNAIRDALKRYRAQPHQAEAIFFCADGSNLPFKMQSFDYILIYGVLHHLPDPGFTCGQIAQILKPNGIYFGSENNQTVFRSIFDLLMKVKPLWYEEAGTEPLISEKQFREWFANTPVKVEINTHVFVPPHLVNLMGQRLGKLFLSLTDSIGKLIPFIRKNGGLIQCYGTCNKSR